jgi:hypothetical protein
VARTVCHHYGQPQAEAGQSAGLPESQLLSRSPAVSRDVALVVGLVPRRRELCPHLLSAVLPSWRPFITGC